MAYPNIEAILDDGGDITVGRVAGECVGELRGSTEAAGSLDRQSLGQRNDY
jgi:hypothetical protein